MQQQREGERTREALTPLGKTQYAYNTRFFWFYRFAYRLSFLGAPFIIFILFTAKSINIGMILFFFFLFSEIVNWQKNLQEERWMWKHGRERLFVSEEGIEWQGKNQTIQMPWDEIAHAYIKDNVCVLVKRGVAEAEIRFFNSKWLENRHHKGDDTTKRLLSTLVEERCPILWTQPWEQKNQETLKPKSTRSDYQTLSGQIFSYHTKTNLEKTWLPVPVVATLALLTHMVGLRLSHITIIAPFALLTVILISLYSCYRWQWYRRSQIETDDLGIALIEPKGITWRVLWFAVDTYTTNSTHGTLITKEGKKYKFPLNTARKDELEAEIHRRIRGE
jgi:hypothetical protein